MNLETNVRIVQAFSDGKYPIRDAEFWSEHMSDKHFVMDLLKTISEAYYSPDPAIGEMLDKIEARIYQVTK